MAKRVLITDDALFMRVTLKNILSKHGYEIAGEAANGRESVEMYKSLRPDLVTMDISFNGIFRQVDREAVTQLRTNLRN